MSDPGELGASGILQLGTAFWASKVLLSAVELDVFTALAEMGPSDADTVARRVGLHQRSASDFLDALVALGMLRRLDETYDCTAGTATYLDRNKPSYVGGFLEMANSRIYEQWGNLTDALRTGEPQYPGSSENDIFTALYDDDAGVREIAEAMGSAATLMGGGLARWFPWDRYESFVDVGGSAGGVAAQIAMSHAHLKGRCFDLPALEPVFAEKTARYGLGERLTFHAGDFFADQLPPADVIIFGHVLHDWGVDQRRILIHKAFTALPPGGALVVYDAMLDDARKSLPALLMSLHMLIETREGGEYTPSEATEWLTEEGFTNITAEGFVAAETLLVGHKP
jgi:predicted transcriptional regulator